MIPLKSLPETYQEAFDQVFQLLNNSLKNRFMLIFLILQICRGKVAFYTHDIAERTLGNSIPCELTSIRTGKMKTVAMITPKGSEYLDVINYQ